MVHIRSLIGLLFLLNSLKDCSLAHQDDYNKFLLAEDSVVSTAGKEFIDGLKAARKFGFGRGRKMIVEEVERKKESEKGSFNGGRALKKEKEISGAKCFGDMKCEYYQVKKNRFSVKCKIRDKLKECVFVAFGDDYQPPKHHSPNHH